MGNPPVLKDIGTLKDSLGISIEYSKNVQPLPRNHFRLLPTPNAFMEELARRIR